ncbi:lipocalin family protein [uncultured Flavobacterium sp.]|uniref:lipocalin family protein n=1 Tax=uncultured Flavobacterium sp. TaxID=165435 RepID=UPI0030821B48
MKITKYLLLIFLCTLTISCQKIQTDKLIGSWRMKDLVNTTGKNFEDKTTFTKNHVIILESISNGKTLDKEIGNYILKNNLLTIKFKNNYSFDFKILKLDDSEMELLNIKEKRSVRYIR